jgi:hypothetical protein
MSRRSICRRSPRRAFEQRNGIAPLVDATEKIMIRKAKSKWTIGMLFAALATSMYFSARADEIATEEDAAPDAELLQQLYEDHLAENAAPIPEPTDEEIAADNFGCPDDTAFWMRDSLTPLCEPRCTSDADCAPDDGRCRLLDLNDLSAAPPMLLVDDMSAEDVAAVLDDPSKSIPPLEICDPFFDVVGATDADVLATE